jgi:translation initiation factor IF-2
MGKKLFVASLPFDFTSEQLNALFAAIAAVESAEMVPDRKSGKTRGFGFVTMVDEAGAQAAMTQLNGTLVGDRKVWITEARPRDGGSEEGGSKPSSAYRGTRPRDDRRPGGGKPFPSRRPRPEGGDDEQQPSGFDQLFNDAPPPSGEPRRPFGRSGRTASPGYSPYYPSNPTGGERGRFQRGRPEGGRGGGSGSSRPPFRGPGRPPFRGGSDGGAPRSFRPGAGGGSGRPPFRGGPEGGPGRSSGGPGGGSGRPFRGGPEGGQGRPFRGPGGSGSGRPPFRGGPEGGAPRSFRGPGGGSGRPPARGGGGFGGGSRRPFGGPSGPGGRSRGGPPGGRKGPRSSGGGGGF